MKTLNLIRPLSALALLTLFAPAALAQETPESKPTRAQVTKRVLIPLGPLPASDLVERWAKAAKKMAVIARGVHDVKIEFNEAGDLDFESVKTLLSFHGVLVHERGDLLLAYRRRDLYRHMIPTQAPVLGPQDPLPQRPGLVTQVVPVEHGGGSAIFASLRGLMARDSDRSGQILLLQRTEGPSQIVLHDLASKVAYYRKLIEQLDQAPASPRVAVAVYELPRKTWRALREKHQGEQLRAALAKAAEANQATTLESFELTSLQGRFRTKKQVRLQDRSLALEVNTRAVKPSKPHLRAEPKVYLELNVTLTRPEGSTERQVSAPLSATALRGKAQVSAFTLAGGAQPTQLVLVLRGR